MTTKVKDLSKRNCVIMGRFTYFGIPPKRRPLPGRLNIVLSRNSEANEYPNDVILCKSLSEAIDKLANTNFGNDIENIWICGGYNVYKEAMASTDCHRVYFTDVKANFDCDAFFPEIPSDFKLIANDENVPTGVQEEDGVKYEYKLYERCN